jgi:multiple sugar transport system ATP-binding protein
VNDLSLKDRDIAMVFPIRQFARPQEIYTRPADLFVAGFIGSPSMNFIPAPVLAENGTVGVRLTSGKGSFVLPLPYVAERPSTCVGKEVIMGIRPEQITDAMVSQHVNGFAHQCTLPVDMVEPTGSDTLVLVLLNGTKVVCRVRPEQAQALGSMTDLVFDTSKVVCFDAQTEKRVA